MYDTFLGVFAVFLDADTDLIVHTIARGAVFDEEVVRVGSESLSPGNTVLDVGANLGQMTVLFARAVGPTGRVLAFEADNYIADLLRLNVGLNGLTNVDIVEAAVWSESDRPLHYPE
jgi:predicted RNA methylase